jgi:hypothetical protein
VQTKTLAILERAEKAGELRTALSAIREVRGNLELLAKLLGELRENPTVNLVVAPQWLTLRATILQVLEPYPDARNALCVALAREENRAGG